MIGICGNNCLSCPRYASTQSDENRKLPTSQSMPGINNRINLMQISRISFWALVIARVGYANPWDLEETAG